MEITKSTFNSQLEVVMKRKNMSITKIAGLAMFAVLLAGCNLGDLNNNKNALDCTPADPNALIFEQAVCLCGDLDKVGSGLSTSGFSSYGRRTETARLAHVGINGNVSSVGSLKVDGTFTVAGQIDSQASVMIKEDLFVGSSLATWGHMSVDRDAFVDGDVSGHGQLEVAGALSVAGDIAMTGNLKCDDVSSGAGIDIQPPCSCDPADLIDVAAEVAAHRDAQAIELPSGKGQNKITLSEGDYYAASGAIVNGNMRIKIEGAVRLFIEGDIEIVGSGFIELTEGAELDLYLAGGIKKVGNLQVGYPKRPSASRAIRMYIGGDENVELDLHGHTRLEGSIYAPQTDIRYQGNLTIEGALFARNVTGTGHLWVRYDAGLTGVGCDPDDDTGNDHEDPDYGDDGNDPDDGDDPDDGNDGDDPDDGDDGNDPDDGDDGDDPDDGDDGDDPDDGDDGDDPDDGDDGDDSDDVCDPADDTCVP
jgi:cytoskeletal protein CcmA (bactofilin family)